MVVIDAHASQSTDASVVITYVNITYLGNTSVIIVINRYVLYLNYRTVIIILGVRAIIITRVKGNTVSTSGDATINVKIKLTIRIYRKRNAIFDKNK
ncbi:Putative membrane protein [Zobellia galactanivorans]|uniref:Putative membrane protein n=1 Tax=Zobellia galactanivorans (strain DSM 12802 / CCUG 47099 / CIP 106680 / NCIMB 13871 / Dsij) TaxID=63186 RepID=G0L2U4_ZOBGA|nr:Putative membrane protein [Zobellia galactanivorans]